MDDSPEQASPETGGVTGTSGTLRNQRLAGVLASLATAVLYVLAFPSSQTPETAYVFAIPMLLWFAWGAPRREAIIASLVVGYASWVILIWWLRHVTLPGTLILAAILGLFLTGWLLAARWTMRRVEDKPLGVRMLAMAGLAGFWVVLEWVRTWFLGGFPWLPLAASQWNRPAILQSAAWFGAWGISFLLVFFNIGVALYIRHLLRLRKPGRWYHRLCPEFYAALGLLVFGMGFMLVEGIFNRRDYEEAFFTAGFVQPYIRDDLKWEPGEAEEILRVLERLSRFAQSLGAEVILWPEAATPWPAIGNPRMEQWIEDLAADLGTPILMGNLARESDDRWHNIVASVSPTIGLNHRYYAKRKLVPFGEYVPFRSVLGFLEKVVPLEGAFKPGDRAGLVPVTIDQKFRRSGPLVCYEDIFPHLAREQVEAGADYLFVATNNAWYGEESGAYQHAAHSVLRAVETRRPVLRSGNGGWSGFIDEYGNIRKVLLDPQKGVYFRGVDTVEFNFDRRLASRRSVYVVLGDWFVWVCMVLAAAGAIALVRSRTAEPGISTALEARLAGSRLSRRRGKRARLTRAERQEARVREARERFKRKIRGEEE